MMNSERDHPRPGITDGGFTRPARRALDHLLGMVGAGMLVAFALFYGLLVFPVAAWLLWDDHRGWAWIAILGVFTASVGQLAVPLGTALVIYGATDDGRLAAGVGGAIMLVIVVASLAGSSGGGSGDGE
jgi:hypothetical protein